MSNDLERSDEELIKATEFENVCDKDRKEDDVKKTNTFSLSVTFIKSSRQFNASIAEEKDSDANIIIKVIDEEKLIDFFLVLTE